MRGKNIISLPLIVALFSVLLMSAPVKAAPTPRLAVTPAYVSGGPGDRFDIDINIYKVRDLFTFGFYVSIAPYSSVLIATGVEEGPFLAKEGYNTTFEYTIDFFTGDIYIMCTLLGPDTPGTDGSGTLATVSLAVVDIGESPLELRRTDLFDSDGEPIPHRVKSGEYVGPKVDLVDVSINPGRIINTHYYNKAQFNVTVKNTATIPLYAMATCHILGEEYLANIQSGQLYIGDLVRDPVVLYVNEYNEFLEWDWTNPGASVIGTPDDDYAESIVNGAMSSSYGFEDITYMGPNDFIADIVLEGYTQYPNGPNDGVDIDVYTTSPTVFDWLGSLFGGSDWAWGTTRWIGATVGEAVPILLGPDPTNLNNLEVLLYNYHGDAANPMRVDSLRLTVYFARAVPLDPIEQVVNPGETLSMDLAEWAVSEALHGRYTLNVKVWFSSDGTSWIKAEKEYNKELIVRWRP